MLARTKPYKSVDMLVDQQQNIMGIYKSMKQMTTFCKLTNKRITNRFIAYYFCGPNTIPLNKRGTVMWVCSLWMHLRMNPTELQQK